MENQEKLIKMAMSGVSKSILDNQIAPVLLANAQDRVQEEMDIE
jgi:hypothetical protein